MHIECPPNRFGPECSYECECERGTCDPVNGFCTCPEKYIGATCNISEGK